jgi:hypothetical protein
MSDTVIIILSSTLLASVVSSVISYIINKKNISMQYITTERQAWRNSIRELAEKIYNVDINNIGLELVKLKVRINSYGRYYKSYEFDTHIWDLIKKLEKSKNDNDDFKRNKDLLIDYLSILLKYDWERSKTEIIGNKKFLLRVLFYISTISLVIYFYFYMWLLPLTPDLFDLLFIITGYYFITPDYDLIKYIDIIKKKKISKNSKKSEWIQYILTLFIISIFAVIRLITIYKLIPMKNFINFYQFMLIFILITIGIFINLIEGQRKLFFHVTYNNSIANFSKSIKTEKKKKS